MQVKPPSSTTYERIKLILVEEAGRPNQPMDQFIEKTALRLLELIQDEKKYN